MALNGSCPDRTVIDFGYDGQQECDLWGPPWDCSNCLYYGAGLLWFELDRWVTANFCET